MGGRSVLEQILARQRPEVERRKRDVPIAALEARAQERGVPLNLEGSLVGDRVQLIAEVKRASPSRGLIRGGVDPTGLARVYADNGAAAISVLTEAEHFRGSLADLEAVVEAVADDRLPVLRKDFHYDPYQLYEARAYGADAVLLIVAMLELPRLKELLAVAEGLWLQSLVEVHSRSELEVALEAGAHIIGINNRDLRTLEVDTSLAGQLRPHVPHGRVVVAESGIRTADDVRALKRAAIDAVLVGEALMTAPNTAAKVRELSGV